MYMQDIIYLNFMDDKSSKVDFEIESKTYSNLILLLQKKKLHIISRAKGGSKIKDNGALICVAVNYHILNGFFVIFLIFLGNVQEACVYTRALYLYVCTYIFLYLYIYVFLQ